MSQPLDSRQLRAFVTLCRTGSFTHAARELNLTQSAISHAMKALEGDVGCRLLDRLGKKALPTESGELLLSHATRILAQMDQTRSELRHLGKWGQSRLRLGATATACQHILPRVMRAFKTQRAGCEITVQPGDTPDLVPLLAAHKVDLAVCLAVENDERLEQRALFTDELAFIVSPEHPWAIAGKVTREQIANQPMITYGRKSRTFGLIERYFREEDIVLKTYMELGDIEAIKALIKLGLGISVLSTWTARQEIADGTLVALPLGRRKLKRNWAVMYWRGRRLSLAEEEFIALCRKHAPQVVGE